MFKFFLSALICFSPDSAAFSNPGIFPDFSQTPMNIPMGTNVLPICDHPANPLCFNQWSQQAIPLAVQTGGTPPLMNLFAPIFIPLSPTIPKNLEDDSDWITYTPPISYRSRSRSRRTGRKRRSPPSKKESQTVKNKEDTQRAEEEKEDLSKKINEEEEPEITEKLTHTKSFRRIFQVNKKEPKKARVLEVRANGEKTITTGEIAFIPVEDISVTESSPDKPETAKKPVKPPETPAEKPDTARPPKPPAEKPETAKKPVKPPETPAEKPETAKKPVKPPETPAEKPETAKKPVKPPETPAEKPETAKKPVKPPEPPADKPETAREPVKPPETPADKPETAKKPVKPPEPPAKKDIPKKKTQPSSKKKPSPPPKAKDENKKLIKIEVRRDTVAISVSGKKTHGCISLNQSTEAEQKTEADYCFFCAKDNTLSRLSTLSDELKDKLKGYLKQVSSKSAKRLKGKISGIAKNPIQKICSPEKSLKQIIMNFNKDCPSHIIISGGKPFKFKDFFNSSYCSFCKKGIPPEIMFGMMSIESSGKCKAQLKNKHENSIGLFQINSKFHRCRNYRLYTLQSIANKKCLMDPINNKNKAVEILLNNYKSLTKKLPAKNSQCPSWQSMSSRERDHWREAISAYNGGPRWVKKAKTALQKDLKNRKSSKKNISWEDLRLYYFMDKLRDRKGRAIRNSISNLAHVEAIVGRNRKGSPPGIVEVWSQYVQKHKKTSCP